jgi:hypothetical protein
MGGSVELNSVGLGFWTRKPLQRRSDDLFEVLTEQTYRRLNIITKKVYGKDSLAWLVLQYNNIIDPIEELKPGVVVALPHPSRII